LGFGEENRLRLSCPDSPDAIKLTHTFQYGQKNAPCREHRLFVFGTIPHTGRYSLSQNFQAALLLLQDAKTKVLKKVWKSSSAKAAEDRRGGRLFLRFSQLVTAASYNEADVSAFPQKVFFPAPMPQSLSS
jgi:hypothetical protein